MHNKMKFLVLLSMAIAACSPSAKSPMSGSANSEFLDGLFTTRPTVDDPVIAILKLQTPALLETSARKDGKLTVDQDQLKAIEAEQAATIDALQKISPDIRVLIRYKMVLNGMAVWTPANLTDKIKSIPNVTMSEKTSSFARPKPMDDDNDGTTTVGAETSVKFIGADAAYQQNIHGEGVRVGIIDTGIDYTHKMLGGEGTVEAYKNNDPSKANAAFPNKKVVGGIDLVGTDYNSASPDFKKRIPLPDSNPLDEAGHGTHVAGTVAGVGDGVNTYSGVAPAADLYAIKVFGAQGSTSDEVVIAALEYAVNPSGDMQFNDQLDVVNLSLGSAYGGPHIMYNTAIKNLVHGGTVVVASAGNEGDQKFIVGAPSVSDDAISVASSVDDQNQNIEFPSALFTFGSESLTAQAIEGSITKKLSTFDSMKGELIALGNAATDFDQATKDQTKGKIAFIDRGVVSFADKIKRAQDAGAIAIIVADNQDEDPIVMGGDGKFDIPSVMISKKDADVLKSKLQAGPVTVDLKPATKVEKPWLADTISPFSSRGPRSEDGLIKPEIAAPGSNIISAGRGQGDKGVLMSGTSMAGPHITGVMALLKQKFNKLDPYELKSVLLAHGKVISDANKKQYTVSRQGAGRVQIADSLESKLVTIPSTLSFGLTDIETAKTLTQQITLKNISDKALTVSGQWNGSAALQVSAPSVTLAAGESKTVTVTAKINATLMASANDELDGFFKFSSDKEMVAQLPGLVVARQISQISVTSNVVHSTSEADAAGSAGEVTLQNKGVNPGSAYLFNLLGKDGRKKDSKPDLIHNLNCDLQSAGYRIVQKDGQRILQVALKLYEGMTTWNTCEVNVQIDADGDGITDQEIAGLPQSSLPGLTGDNFISLLLDGTKARQMRKKYETDFATNPDKAKEDYSQAVMDIRKMGVFDGSTLAIIEADVSQLEVSDTQELNIKVSTTLQDSGAVEYDDYLGKDDTKWEKISLSDMGQSYSQLPEQIDLKGHDTVTVPFVKGYDSRDLILYAPQNKSVRDVLLEDTQSQIVPAAYQP